MINDILDFWFAPRDSEGRTEPSQKNFWFEADADFDRQIADKFGAAIEDALHGGPNEEWLTTPQGTLAFILLADQFTRNVYRGTAKAFAGDANALSAAKHAVQNGFDRQLGTDERAFVYMPFEHSENLLDQHTCVGLFTQMRDEAADKEREAAGQSLRYAHGHRDIIQRFGRFPHRNATLNRASTPEELKYLESASTYGQGA